MKLKIVTHAVSRVSKLTTPTIKMEALLSSLLVLSDKGATIARLFRSHGDLLVEEKTGEDKNKRFTADYKSLADVLIQETFKHFLSNQVIHFLSNQSI